MTRIKYGRIVIIMLVAAAISLAAEPAAKESIENARAILEQMVKTRRTISKEKQDWELGREILNERINLVQREIKSLREKISQAEQSISDADTKRAELIEQSDKLKNASVVLKDIVTRLEARTISLNKQLPDPIRERIKPLSLLIPKDPNETKLSLSQRFEKVIGILNEVNKFNLEITPTTEVRTLTDGNAAEVTVLYIGLGQAYYVGANGTVAGIGRPSENGWNWEPANDAAGGISDAVAILKNEKVAGFVPLPVEIQ